MTQRKKHKTQKQHIPLPQELGQKRPVSSLLDAMQDGREFASLVDIIPHEMNFAKEFQRGIQEVESIRKCPLICYVGNILRGGDLSTSVALADDVPFSEMIDTIPQNQKELDILLATPGGSGQQISNFVNKLRPRFSHVAFLIPHIAMSAGTIWLLSGNEIYMDERSFIGPIDPQVPGKDGRYLPAQALLTLIKQIQDRGYDAISKGQAPLWSDIQILKNIDGKEIGNVIALSNYSIQLASEYLEKYKFADWLTHHDGRVVTNQEKKDRALEIATKLCSHESWKVHSHGIFRDVAWNELKIKINHLESIPGLQRSVRRLWALFYWTFENTNLQKIFISEKYSLFRMQIRGNIS
jgi:hypothetical protein